MKRKLAALLTALMLLSSLPALAAEESTYIPGAYMGTAEGCNGPILVVVQVDEAAILNILTTTVGETEEIGGAAIDLLTEAILAAQSTEVDSISGATLTSTAFQAAVSGALENARTGTDPFPVDSDADASEILDCLAGITPYPEYDWESQWAARTRQHKIDLGMPYPDGANVSLNGEFLDFGGLAPLKSQYNIQIPFRAFLEGLGGRVDYRDGQFVAELPGDLTITAAPDSSTLTYTVGDKITEVEMYAPPTVLDRAAYVEAWALAEALGLDCAVDNDYDAIHLTDWDQIAAQIDEDFTILNTLAAVQGITLDPAKTYALDMGASGSATLYGETARENGTARLSASLKGLLQGGRLDFTYGVGLDLGKLRDMVTREMDEEGSAFLDLLSDFQMQLRGDLASGQLYVKGNQLDRLPESPLPADTWIAAPALPGLDIDALYEAANAKAGARPVTAGVLLTKTSRRAYGGFPPCQTALGNANLANLLFGDANFQTSTVGSTAAYTLSMDSAKLAARYQEITGDRLEEIDGEAFLARLKNGLDIQYEFTARTRDGRLTSSKLTGSVKLSAAETGFFPVEFQFSVNGGRERADLILTVKGDYIGKAEFQGHLSLTKSTRSVPTAPSSGEKVINYSDLSR